MLLNRRMRVRIWNREGRCSLVREALAFSSNCYFPLRVFSRLRKNGPNDPAGEVSVDLSSATAAGRYEDFITAAIECHSPEAYETRPERGR